MDTALADLGIIDMLMTGFVLQGAYAFDSELKCYQLLTTTA